MKASAPLVALAALALAARLPASAAGPTGRAKDGYCYNVPPLADVFDLKDCGACLQNQSCSTCDQDAHCPGAQKCCPGDCGYVCQEAILDFCQLPSVCGNCKAMFPRYFYNASSQKCEQFIYGGCGGNRNNFETEEECFKTCSFPRAPA